MTPTDKIAEYKHILEMIEGVSVDDRDTLNEIDARCWCVENNEEFHEVDTVQACADNDFITEKLVNYKWGQVELVNYTTSLDACVSIQEDGWGYEIFVAINGKVTCKAFTYNDGIKIGRIAHCLPTIPLAWSHAIIQTKIWRLENDPTT